MSDYGLSIVVTRKEGGEEEDEVGRKEKRGAQ